VKKGILCTDVHIKNDRRYTRVQKEEKKKKKEKKKKIFSAIHEEKYKLEQLERIG
jgi:hypothetical protein